MSGTKDAEIPEERRSVVWPQWLAAFAVSLAVIVSGLANGWASPYLAQLTSTEANVPLRLTDTETSWLASLLYLGRIVGVSAGAVSQGYIGRKRALLLGGLPLASSWIFDICETSVFGLYASRFCSGIGSGIIWPVLSLYLGEIADPAIRGSLISMNINLASMGTFLGNVMGPYLSMEMFAYVSLVPNILFVVLFSLVPESPYHYVLQGDIDKAEESLKWFRREPDVKAEMQELQDFVDGARGTNIRAKLKEFVVPANLKKAIILLLLNVFVYMSGYTTIISYAEIIVVKCRVSLNPSFIVMALGFSTIVAGSSAIFTVDRIGRRRLLMMSAVGASMSLLLLGIHFHLLSLGFDPDALTWLPIAAMLSFNFSVSCGLVPVPSALLGEMFPASMKNLAALFISTTNALLCFASARSYQPYVELVGEKYVFWTFSFILLASVPFVYYFIPETKGKTLLEIQRSKGTGK